MFLNIGILYIIIPLLTISPGSSRAGSPGTITETITTRSFSISSSKNSASKSRWPIHSCFKMTLDGRKQSWPCVPPTIAHWDAATCTVAKKAVPRKAPRGGKYTVTKQQRAWIYNALKRCVWVHTACFNSGVFVVAAPLSYQSWCACQSRI